MVLYQKMLIQDRLVQNTGVMGSVLSGAGSTRRSLGGSEYGTGLGIYAYGDGAQILQYSKFSQHRSGVIGDVSAVVLLELTMLVLDMELVLQFVLLVIHKEII